MRCPDPVASQAMKDTIERAIEEGNTLGGTLEVIALGLPPGLGSYVHWDRRLDARLGQAILSIHAIKGVEIGPAFANSRQPGTRVHDAIRLQDQQLQRTSDRSGGIEGGMSTGQPLLIRPAMKTHCHHPQPPANRQSGRRARDAPPIRAFRLLPLPRAVPVIEAMLAFVLADPCWKNWAATLWLNCKDILHNWPNPDCRTWRSTDKRTSSGLTKATSSEESCIFCSTALRGLAKPPWAQSWQPA